MAVLMSEEQHKKARKKLTILGILFIILGFGLFFGGPICAFLIHPIWGLISMAGILFLVPGFIMLSMGTSRALAAFQAQSAGPVAVEAAHDYGRPIVKEMVAGAKDGLTGENEEIYCKYCGNRIAADSTFCKYCGKKLN